MLPIQVLLDADCYELPTPCSVEPLQKAIIRFHTSAWEHVNNVTMEMSNFALEK